MSTHQCICKSNKKSSTNPKDYDCECKAEAAPVAAPVPAPAPAPVALTDKEIAAKTHCVENRENICKDIDWTSTTALSSDGRRAYGGNNNHVFKIVDGQLAGGNNQSAYLGCFYDNWGGERALCSLENGKKCRGRSINRKSFDTPNTREAMRVPANGPGLCLANCKDALGDRASELKYVGLQWNGECFCSTNPDPKTGFAKFCEQRNPFGWGNFLATHSTTLPANVANLLALPQFVVENAAKDHCSNSPPGRFFACNKIDWTSTTVLDNSHRAYGNKNNHVFKIVDGELAGGSNEKAYLGCFHDEYKIRRRKTRLLCSLENGGKCNTKQSIESFDTEKMTRNESRKAMRVPANGPGLCLANCKKKLGTRASELKYVGLGGAGNCYCSTNPLPKPELMTFCQNFNGWWKRREFEKALRSPQAVIACGNKDHNSCKDMKLESFNEKHAVRCCSDTAKEGYVKKSGCSVWAASKFSVLGKGNAGCAGNKTLSEANAICKAEGARLCTAEEVHDNKCTIRTGCGHDARMIWTSSTKVPSTDGPLPAQVANLVSLPQPIVEKASNYCNQNYSSKCDTKIDWTSENALAGRTKYGNRNNHVFKIVDGQLAGGSNQTAYLGCFRDYYSVGGKWERALCSLENGKKCNTAQSRKGFNKQPNSKLAMRVPANGPGLCLANCKQALGDRASELQYVGLQGNGNCYCSTNPDPKTGFAKFCQSTNNSGWIRFGWALSREGVLACGDKNNESCKGMKIARTSERHPVRCCSDTAKEGYVKRDGCSVWAGSKFSVLGEGNAGCANDRTLAEANAICRAEGARLCTAEEVHDKRCTIRTGCGHDARMIWTSSPSANCGGHSAVNCGACPDNNGTDMGKAWCNGECGWATANNSCTTKALSDEGVALKSAIKEAKTNPRTYTELKSSNDESGECRLAPESGSGFGGTSVTFVYKRKPYLSKEQCQRECDIAKEWCVAIQMKTSGRDRCTLIADPAKINAAYSTFKHSRQRNSRHNNRNQTINGIFGDWKAKCGGPDRSELKLCRKMKTPWGGGSVKPANGTNCYAAQQTTTPTAAAAKTKGRTYTELKSNNESGECRLPPENGQLRGRASVTFVYKGQPDLSKEQCQEQCDLAKDWCVAIETSGRESCTLVADPAKINAEDSTFQYNYTGDVKGQNGQWRHLQTINGDSSNWRAKCASGTALCRNIKTPWEGGRVNPRRNFNCYVAQ